MSAPGTLPGDDRFPIPLVGTVAILLVLIVFTPILFSSGRPVPGSFETQAELVVDQVSAGTNITFYVHAVGPTVRYASIDLGVAGGFSWAGACPSSGLAWAWKNATNVVTDQIATATNPVAVSVTAVYTSDGLTANYSAVLAFFSSSGTLASSACFGATPPSSPQPLASLPLLLLLSERSSGGPP